MSGSDYLDLIVRAEADLQAAFTRSASKNNNAGGSCCSSISFPLSDLPAARTSLVQSGELTDSIPLPEGSSYYGVVFTDVRACLGGLSSSGKHSTISLNLVKAGTSVFQGRSGKQHRFTHDETSPAIGFSYSASTCAPLSNSDARLQGGNMQDVYVRYSPYGTWKLTVPDHASLQLDAVTEVRFEFNLQYKPGSFGGHSIFFDGDVGCLSELGAAACAADGAVVPAPTPPSPPSHSNTGTGGDDPIVCTDYNDLNTLLTPVNSECCDEPSEDCSSGYPATCNAGCAALLLPLQAACAGFLATSPVLAPVKAAIDAVAATCPSSGSGH
jgi:hypothetical protein